MGAEMLVPYEGGCRFLRHIAIAIFAPLKRANGEQLVSGSVTIFFNNKNYYMPIWDKPLGGGLIATAGNVINSVANWITGNSSAKKQYKYNMKMYNQQRKDNLSDWNMVNQYNSPAAQMGRFKEAGLNPHLIYGQTNEGGSVRSADVKSWEPHKPNIDVGIADGAAVYQQLRMQRLAEEKLRADTDVSRKDAILRDVQMLQIAANTDNTRFSTQQARRLADGQYEAQQLSLKKIGQEMQLNLNADRRAGQLNNAQVSKVLQEIYQMKLQGAKTQAETQKIGLEMQHLIRSGLLQQYEIDLNKDGLQKSDNIIFRQIMHYWNKVKRDRPGWLR